MTNDVFQLWDTMVDENGWVKLGGLCNVVSLVFVNKYWLEFNHQERGETNRMPLGVVEYYAKDRTKQLVFCFAGHARFAMWIELQKRYQSE